MQTPATSIPATIADLAEDFAMLDEWEERYRHVIDLGRRLPPWPEEDRHDAERIQGCQSRVWLRAEVRDDRLHFRAASDSSIVQGLLALILAVYDARRPEEIMAQGSEFLTTLGLEDHLSLSRRNGVTAVLGRIRALAAAA